VSTQHAKALPLSPRCPRDRHPDLAPSHVCPREDSLQESEPSGVPPHEPAAATDALDIDSMQLSGLDLGPQVRSVQVGA